jgi:hypothetical protein
MHGIHGRATAGQPVVFTAGELVWIVTGDGDGLSIGSSRNSSHRGTMQITLFNNQIYGLTRRILQHLNIKVTKIFTFRRDIRSALALAIEPMQTLMHVLWTGPKHLQAMLLRCATA